MLQDFSTNLMSGVPQRELKAKRARPGMGAIVDARAKYPAVLHAVSAGTAGTDGCRCGRSSSPRRHTPSTSTWRGR